MDNNAETSNVVVCVDNIMRIISRPKTYTDSGEYAYGRLYPSIPYYYRYN